MQQRMLHRSETRVLQTLVGLWLLASSILPELVQQLLPASSSQLLLPRLLLAESVQPGLLQRFLVPPLASSISPRWLRRRLQLSLLPPLVSSIQPALCQEGLMPPLASSVQPAMFQPLFPASSNRPQLLLVLYPLLQWLLLFHPRSRLGSSCRLPQAELSHSGYLIRHSDLEPMEQSLQFRSPRPTPALQMALLPLLVSPARCFLLLEVPLPLPLEGPT